MATLGCATSVTAFTERLPSGWQAIRLRSATVDVTLLPDKGGELYALTARRHGPNGPRAQRGHHGQHGTDVLWKAPWGLRPPPIPSSSGPESQAVWLDHYGGGWQELCGTQTYPWYGSAFLAVVLYLGARWCGGLGRI